MEYKFIADGNVGKLARLLRMLGFDTVYHNELSKEQLLEIAMRENRLVLSRYPGFNKSFPERQSFIVTQEDPYIQLQLVVQHFDLKERLHPFTRCIICNDVLQPVSKESIANRLQPNTAFYFNDFRQCSGCNRVYWKGSHYEHMLELAEQIAGKKFN